MENLPQQLKEKFLSRLDGRMQGEAVLRYFIPEEDQDVKHMNLSWLEELHTTSPLVWSFEPYFAMPKRLPRFDSLMIPANTRLALIRSMPKTIKRLELIMPMNTFSEAHGNHKRRRAISAGRDADGLGSKSSADCPLARFGLAVQLTETSIDPPHGSGDATD